MLILWEADFIGGFAANVGLALFGGSVGEDFSEVGSFDDFEVEGLDVAEVDEELVGAHFYDVFLGVMMITCLSSVFSEMRMKVPELLPQSLRK